MSSPTLPEILAPGGDSDSVRAAILAGADAVYVGLDRFNARIRASNVSLDELSKLCAIAHSHGTRIYVTLNVLVSEEEFDDATALGLAALNAGADALIIQNLGLLAWFHAHVPEAELHASTQLTTHSQAQLEHLARLGVQQVNLARELALDEIRAVVPRAHGLGMKVEVFVHGAYCVSFSGQCHLSASMTGLSANRGACVQSCRRPFTSPDASVPSLPLNLKDNNAIAHAKELVEACVDSVKIEGRRKNYYYVYTTVGAWRRRLDELAGHARRGLPEEAALGSVFHRGFSAGYLEGRISSDMFAEAASDQSLRRVGEVLGYTADTHILRCSRGTELTVGARAGVFADEDKYVARFVVEAALGDARYTIRLEHELKGHVRRGHAVWALAEQDEATRVLEQVQALDVHRQRLDVEVRGRVGEPLVATFQPETGAPVESRSAIPLELASRSALDHTQLTRQLGRLGGTAFALGTVTPGGLDDGLFLPVSELNRVRQAALAELPGGTPRVWSATTPTPDAATQAPATPGSETLLAGHTQARAPQTAPFQRLLFVTDTLERAHALRRAGHGPLVVLELQGPDISALTAQANAEQWLVPAFPSIIFDTLMPAYEAVLAARPWQMIWSEHSGVGAHAAAMGIPWLAGGLLNTSNAHAARAFAAIGAAGVVAAPELTTEQVAAMGTSLDGDLLRLVTVFGPVLCMQTRQCLVRSFKGCRVPYTNETCVRTCRAGGQLDQESGHTFHAIKRPGFHNQLWDARLLFCPEAVPALHDSVDTFVVDLRDPGFCPRSEEATLALAGGFAKLVDAARDAKLEPKQWAKLRDTIGRSMGAKSFGGGLQPRAAVGRR